MDLFSLHVESSENVCAVALANQFGLIDEKLEVATNQHSKLLHPMIDDLMKKNLLKFEQLNFITVNKGPGSYTGLRIGVSAVKGLAYSLNIPIIGLNSFEILLSLDFDFKQETDYIIPMLDARRNEVFMAGYDIHQSLIFESQAKVLDENSFQEFAEKKVVFIGSGAEKSKSILSENPNWKFESDLSLKASSQILVSKKKYMEQTFENLFLLVPFYLKEVYIIPKKETKD